MGEGLVFCYHFLLISSSVMVMTLLSSSENAFGIIIPPELP